MTLNLHWPALRLTAAYLALIMVLSIGFSAMVYHISTNELNRGLRRQSTYFNEEPPPTFNTFNQYRLSQQTEESNRLKVNLLLFNVLVLVLGGVGSYVLAGRTIRPIEEALAAQTRFAGDASHELRTPLTAMQTEIEVALRDTKLSTADARALLTSNLEEVAKLKGLTEGLLVLAHTDQQAIAREPLALEGLAGEAIKRVQPAAKAKKITIDLKTSNVKVLGDHASLVELLVTLLDNAVKYSDVGKTVTVTLSWQGKFGLVEVADEGAGIKAPDLPHLFDRFFRADTSRTRGSAEGYGLGLALAKQIAELHHGIIDVRSAPGHGSVFTVRLPLAS